jgi:hypothetical protein
VSQNEKMKVINRVDGEIYSMQKYSNTGMFCILNLIDYFIKVKSHFLNLDYNRLYTDQFSILNIY